MNRFFGLHFSQGIATYKKKDSEPYTVFLSTDTIKSMDATAEGKPIFINHVASNDERPPNGVIVKSFYNSADGCHWIEFMCDDAAAEKIRQGWKISNDYSSEQETVGGLWHGASYDREITKASFNNMALVPDPRYAESVILAPNDFKEYNLKKQAELAKMQNSADPVEPIEQGESEMGFWTKNKMQNSADLEASMVDLPLSKKSVSVKEAVETCDRFMNMKGYANGDHMVKVGDKEMTVNELADCYGKMKNAEDERVKKESEKNAAETPEDKEKREKNEKEEEEKKKQNAEAAEKADAEKAKEAESKKQNSLKLQELKDAANIANDSEKDIVFQNGIELGKKLF
jgi:hypothetical protein